MKILNHLLLLSILITLFGGVTSCELLEELEPNDGTNCDIERTESIANGGGFSVRESPRNHHYTFTVDQENTIVNITAKSNADQQELRMYLLEGSGFATKQVANTGNINSTVAFNELTLASTGTYTLVVTTAEAAKTDYTLSICGKVDDLKKIAANTDEAMAAWTSGGGYSQFRSPRNRKFQFEVTEENTYVDLTVETFSDQVEARIYLFRGEGKNLISIANTGNVNTYTVLPAILLEEPGIYTAVVTTGERIAGDFNFILANLENRITNFTEIESKVMSQSDSWSPTGGGYDNIESPLNSVYRFQCLQEGTAIDVNLQTQSDNLRARLYLLEVDGTGRKIVGNSGNVNPYVLLSQFELEAGKTYEVFANTNMNSSGTYEIKFFSSVGKITEPQKQ